MPSVEYTCEQCSHTFKRVILRGGTPPMERCPRCGSEVKPDKSNAGLFDGIQPFSSLGKDTN